MPNIILGNTKQIIENWLIIYGSEKGIRDKLWTEWKKNSLIGSETVWTKKL